MMLHWRYRRIVFFFARTLLSLTVWELILPRLGLRKWSAATRSQRLQRVAKQYRLMAIRLGGVLIKVGQFLSSRVDVLPREITNELSGLQDEVPPESFEDIRQVAESEFGISLDSKYFWFNEEPLAAASLGQAHLATLRKHSSNVDLKSENFVPQGEDEIIELVVKVQRPDIEKIIATDLSAIKTVGRWLRRYPPIRKRADVPALLDEFTRTLYEEMDYLAEGRNAETFAANFANQSTILVPKVIWTHTTQRVLTLENVQGIKINDYEAITAAGIDREEVASRLLDTYLQQIFQDGFFHADPHPGNLFVRIIPLDKTQSWKSPGWQLTFIDFGMVGRIPPRTRAGFRELLIGVGMRDAERVAKAYQMLDILLPGADLELIEKAEEVIFDRFWGKNMAEMTQVNVEEMREYTRQFRDLIYNMPFQIPQDIIFLVRAVGILSGMCTGLNPEFNVWEHLAPYSKQLIAEEVTNIREEWMTELSNFARKLLAYPGRMDKIIEKLESGKLVVRDPELTGEVKKLELAIWRMTIMLLIAIMILAVVLLYLANEKWLAGIFSFGTIAAWIIMFSRQQQ